MKKSLNGSFSRDEKRDLRSEKYKMEHTAFQVSLIEDTHGNGSKWTSVGSHECRDSKFVSKHVFLEKVSFGSFSEGRSYS